MTTIHSRHYETGEHITIHSGRIISIEPGPSQAKQYIIPSYFDPQINGCLGKGFVSPTLCEDDIRLIADECWRHGIGQFFPTLITASDETFRRNFARLAKTLDSDRELALRIPGFHLEGPYLSAEDGPRGAHLRDQIREPNWDEFQRWQDAAGGRIRLVTIAPERIGAILFIEKLRKNNIVAAIGHTAATGSQIRDAIRAGASMSTHLGNGAHATLPRHPNVIWEQLAADELTASIIADGHHLPPTVIKTFIRAKRDQLILTCDASNLAGLPPGRYREWGQELEVLPTGKIIVPNTPFLAGSGSFLDACVTYLQSNCEVSIHDIVNMACIRARRLFNLTVPSLAIGSTDFTFVSRSIPSHDADDNT